MFFPTRCRTASGLKFSIFYYDNQWDPREVKIHVDTSLDDTNWVSIVHEIEDELRWYLPFPSHEIRLKIYSVEPNPGHIKGRGYWGGELNGKMSLVEILGKVHPR